MLRKTISLLLVFSILLYFPADARASDEFSDLPSLLASLEEQSIAVYEAGTDTFLAGKNENKKVPIAHMTKLMTALVAYDTLQSGKLTNDTKLKTSEYANSMQGTQIWLDVGEEISVHELILAITVSNANDAAVVLAEGCAGSEEKFVSLMNARAKALGMVDTVFTDCTGIDDGNVSTAHDLCLLAGELARNDVFKEEYTTRLAEVGRKGSQLVTQNRLVDNFKGLCGYKSCFDDRCGEMLVTCSKQRDMAVCTVLLGGKNEDGKFVSAKAVMNFAFTHFEVYYPELPEGTLDDIPVTHGQKRVASTVIGNGRNIIIERGTYRQIYTELSRPEEVRAPLEKGQSIGSVAFYNDKGEILVLDICVSHDVKEMDYLFALKTMLCNLFNIV